MEMTRTVGRINLPFCALRVLACVLLGDQPVYREQIDCKSECSTFANILADKLPVTVMEFSGAGHGSRDERNQRGP